MKQLVAAAMKDGALGLSTSLQYVPARFANTDEIVELAKVARQYGGIYATHQRSEANALDESLAEVFQIARARANSRRNLAPENCVQKELGPHARGAGEDQTRARRKVSTSPPTFIPTSPAAPRSALACRRGCSKAALKRCCRVCSDMRIRQHLKEEIMTDSKEWENIYLGSGGASGVLIGSVVNRDLEAMQGKRLSQIAEEQGKEPLDALFDLIVADHGQTGAIYFMMSEDDMRAAMRAPFVSFCTDSGARANDGPLAGAKSHPRGWGSYPRILGRYVREEHLLTLEQAIHKMTGHAGEARWPARSRIVARGLFCRHHHFRSADGYRSRDV